MVEKENTGGSGAGLPISGKKLDPWLGQRLTKADLMYARLPVFLTCQPAPPLGITRPLTASQTPVIPLSHDPDFPHIKSAASSPVWDQVSLFWLLNRRKSQSISNQWTNYLIKDVPQASGEWSIPVNRNNPKVTNHTKLTAHKRDTENKTDSASETIWINSEKKPLLAESPAQHRIDLNKLTPDVALNHKGGSISFSGTSMSKPELGIHVPAHMNNKGSETQYPAGQIRHSQDKVPEKQEESTPGTSHAVENTGNDWTLSVIQKSKPVETVIKSGTSPEIELDTLPEQPFIAASQSENKTGNNKSTFKFSETKERQPFSTTWQGKPAKKSSQLIKKPSRPAARKFEPVARHFVPVARRPKTTSGIPGPLPGQSGKVAGTSNPAVEHTGHRAGQSVPFTYPSKPFIEKPVQDIQPTVSTPLQLQPLAQANKPDLKQAAVQIEYIRPEIKTKREERRWIHPDHVVASSAIYQPVRPEFSNLTSPRKLTIDEKVDTGDNNTAEDPERFRPSSNMSPLINFQKTIITAVRPITRCPDFQLNRTPVSLPANTGSVENKAFSTATAPMTTKTPGGVVPVLRKQEQIIKHINQDLILNRNIQMPDQMVQKNELPAKRAIASIEQTAIMDIVRDDLSNSTGHSPLYQEQSFTSGDMTLEQNNLGTSLPLVKTLRSAKVASAQSPTGWKHPEYLISQAARIHAAENFAFRNFHFSAGIAHKNKTKPEKKSSIEHMALSRKSQQRAISPFFNQSETLIEDSPNYNSVAQQTQPTSAFSFQGSSSSSLSQNPNAPRSGFFTPVNWESHISQAKVQSGQSQPDSNEKLAGNQKTVEFPSCPEQIISYAVRSSGNNIFKAVSNQPVQVFTGQVHTLSKAGEQSINQNHFILPGSVQGNQAKGDNTASGNSNQTAAKTDLKALAREVYPFIKRMIIIDRERFPY